MPSQCCISELKEQVNFGDGEHKSEVQCCDKYPPLYDLSKSLASSLAWPVVMLIVLYFSKDIIKNLANKLIEAIAKAQTIRAGKNGIELEMPQSEVLEKLKKDAVDARLKPLTELGQDSNLKLTDTETMGQVVLKWRELEEALLTLALGVITLSTKQNPTSVINDLHSVGEIDDKERERLLILRGFRNKFVHKKDVPELKKAVQEYLLAIDVMTAEIKKKI